MLVPGDLGFPGLILLFFFSPIISFVIRRKWRIAMERNQEIMRLVAMASEEAARAEVEAAVEYGSAVSVVRQFQCALCYCPTTTRCSRCKAVRYCSGKCQIIHWRQGHKEECHPPNTNIRFNGQGSDSDKDSVLQGEQHEFHGDDLVDTTTPIEAFPEEPMSSKSSHSPDWVSIKEDGKVGSFVDAKREEIISESSSTSSLVGLSTSTKESLVDVAVSEIPLSDDTGPNLLETRADVSHTRSTTPTLSKFTSLDTSVNSFSSSSKLKQMKPSSNGGVVNHGSISLASSIIGSDESTISETSTIHYDFRDETLDSKSSREAVQDGSTRSSFSESGDGNLSDSKTLLHFSFNMSQHAVPNSQSQYSNPKNVISDDADPIISRKKKPVYGSSLAENIVTEASVVKSSPTLSSERLASVDNIKRIDSQLLKRGRVRSLSFSAANDHPSSNTGRKFVPNVKSSKDDSVQTVPTSWSETANSSPNAIDGLKTSVRKVVQQFKVSKLSKHYPLGFGSESSEKYTYKMLFPYELFLKLYHWNKVELHPFGLTNCGNSCYANAVLQCLAFTRPLTAYLLQGFHSKACPKKEWCFTCEFEGLILKAKKGKCTLSPIGILSQLQHIGSQLGCGREEDAHEFLRYAIDTMQSVCLKEAGANVVGPWADETTLMGLIFGGYLRSKIKCMKCQGKSERHERMMDLTVEIQGDIGTLEEALGRFTATEILDGENKYQCSRCKSYQKAKKKLTVLEAPNILTIALKRFQTGKFGKLNKSVQFPEILNLAPYMSGTSDKSPTYMLYAVVVHLDIMNAAFSGHYVCYVRNIQGKWFKIDDSKVKPVELERVLSKRAYMLLYARCSPRAPSLKQNTIISNESKINRGSRFYEAILSSHSGKGTTSKARPSSDTIPSAEPSIAHRRLADYPYSVDSNGRASFEYSDLFDGRFHPLHRIPYADSSSDNSSLFSCSDEGSCSTESTRDSSSTDDISDYIFGEAGRSWNGPLKASDGSPSPLFSRSSHLSVLDRYASCSAETSGYPTYGADVVAEADGGWMTRVTKESSRREGWQDRGSLPFLYTDTTRHCRNLTSSSCSNSSNNSIRETDLEQLGWCNPWDMKSGGTLRRSSREITGQSFY